MKRLLTLVLVVSVLSLVTQLATVKASSVKSSKSNTSDRVASKKASSKLITGKVSQVDAKNRTFVLKAQGKGKMPAYKFFFPKAGAQPKVGDMVEVQYTGTLSGTSPVQATNLNSSRSNIY